MAIHFPRPWRWLAMAGAVVASGCSTDKTIPDPQPVQNKAALTPFQGANACKDLETYIEDTAVLEMRADLEAARDGVPVWGWWGGGFFGRGGVEDAASPAAAGASNSKSAAPTDYTTTNNQVAGVDEADFVKNDGTRIFALSGNTLYGAKSWPADETQVLGKLQIEGWPQQMFLEGSNRVVVFSSIYRWYALDKSAGMACNSLSCGYYNANTVKVSVVDVTDMAAPKLTHEYFIPGQYNNARKVGGSIRIVLNDSFNFPEGVKWYPDYVPGLYEDKAKLKDAYDKIIADNEVLIRAQTLDNWNPPALLKQNGVETSLPQNCAEFSKVNAPTRLGTLSIVTLNLSNSNAIHRTNVVAEWGQVYASANSLYVATRHWWWWPSPGQQDTTYIHKFDISNPDEAIYTASGVVEGYVNDQFSMDEYQGNFRVATTLSSRVPDTQNPMNWWGTIKLTNRVTVLGEASGVLAKLGQTPDLAEGERIQSARFVEDKGFVVTYRQVDPLFTFDLSDPKNPKKIGELKVPGFSTYIHPLDATHLLTVGEFLPDPGTGVVDWNKRSVQLAIFDVSDLANPKQSFIQLVGTSSSYSEALWDHKAFNYFPAKKLLAIPFTDWDWNKTGTDYWNAFTSQLKVFSVDAASGFVSKGAISLNDMYQSQTYSNWTFYWTPAVRRSVMADDFVYAISDSGIRVANIADLSTPLVTATFERAVDPMTGVDDRKP